MASFAAVDLGASSGRVMRAELDRDGIELHEVHRFVNMPVMVHDTLHWDVLALWAGVLDGLRIAATQGPVDGIGVDSWAIDYGLLDGDGRLLGNPVHYRDRRTDGVAAQVAEVLDPATLYATTGVQVLPFNTIFQLAAARGTAALEAAAHALLIPDLFNFWLTGALGTELTNASTTGLLDVRARVWSDEIFAALDVRRDIFPPLREPGEQLGTVLTSVGNAVGVVRTPVLAVGSHDTASAVLAVPARDEQFAYISCGTWSLVGVELEKPVTSEESRVANFSNELGVDGTVRFLRNVMGLWLLQESMRSWERAGHTIDLAKVLVQAEQLPARRSVVDPDRREFLPPGDMPQRLREECRRTGQPEPQTPAEVARCILDSLASAYRRAIETAVALTGARVEVVHLVGGGAQNTLLCQLTADACELPVVAGPVEAAAYGNILVQARATGAVAGDRHALREMLRIAGRTTTYLPRP